MFLDWHIGKRKALEVGTAVTVKRSTDCDDELQCVVHVVCACDMCSIM